MPNKTKTNRSHSPDRATSTHDVTRKLKRPTNEQIARRRAAVLIGIVVGSLLLDKAINYLDGLDKTNVTVTFGNNTNPTDAAQAIEALEGIKSPSNEATNSLASDIVNRYVDTHPDANMTTDLNGAETPIIMQGDTVNVPIQSGNYPQNIYYDVQAGRLTNIDGPGEVQISISKNH